MEKFHFPNIWIAQKKNQEDEQYVCENSQPEITQSEN